MLEEVSEGTDHLQVFIKIKVESKIEQYASYVNYEIGLETNDPSFTFVKSSTRRRYSDFRTLHTMLSKQFQSTKVPNFPPKAPFKRSFDMEFVEKRRGALEEYLAKLLSKKIYLSSRALHLFLQSNYPMTEIKDIVEGKTASIEVNNDVIVHTSISPLNDEEGSSVSSQNALKECEEPIACVLPNSSFPSSSNSPLGSKRVSFCDKVTVAEIHAP